jgi:hypothetical protein
MNVVIYKNFHMKESRLNSTTKVLPSTVRTLPLKPSNMTR